MSSNSKSTETQRLRKNRKTGKDRKKKLAKQGSTRSETELFGSPLRSKST